MTVTLPYKLTRNNTKNYLPWDMKNTGTSDEIYI